MEVSRRLTRWIQTTFPPETSGQVLASLRELPPDVIGGQDPERIHASIVICTGGDWHEFRQRLALANQDWRDALMAADLGAEGWPKRLRAMLKNSGPRPGPPRE